MRHLNRHLFIASLLFTALTAEAVQLGSAKGAAVFGRPLDLSVQVRLDAPTEEAANCFSAEVFQADTKFDAGRVRLDVTPSANGLDATVRVRSATAVNEPWAKVILRSNCGAKVSRQYDFLTDFAAGNMLAETTQAQPIAAVAQEPLSAPDSAPVSNWSVKRSQAKAKASQQKPDTQIAQIPLTSKKIKPIAPAAVSTAGAKMTTEMVAGAVEQSRLKMETFELTDEHQVLLKLSTALVAPTGMRTPEEIQALAQATAVWRAINGMPDEIKAIEAPATDTLAAAQIKAPTVSAPPVTIPTLMNQKLTGKSEFSNLMVYGLIGLLALTLACIAWLWLRVRKASRAGYGWLNDSVKDDAAVDHEQTQFLHSNFYETELVAQEAVEPSFETESEVNTEAETKAAVEEIFTEVAEDENPQVASLSSSPLASLVSHSHSNDTKPSHESTQKFDLKTEKSVTTANKQTIHPIPPHFDDPRFDERVLLTKKKKREASHEQPITSSVELIDLVLADTPPKLRSVATPVQESIHKQSVPAITNKAAAIKDDSKSNLIDFDAFAEPEPLNKPTRFVR
jgi:hypothetical protein